MAGPGGVGSEESMDDNGPEWTEAKSHKVKGKTSGKRGRLNQESSSEDRDGNERIVRRKIEKDGIKVLIKFKEGMILKKLDQ